MGQLSNLQVIGVRGYEGPTSIQKLSGDETKNRFSYERSAVLGIGSFNLGGLSLGLIGGMKQSYQIFGGSLKANLVKYLDTAWKATTAPARFLN